MRRIFSIASLAAASRSDSVGTRRAAAAANAAANAASVESRSAAESDWRGENGSRGIGGVYHGARCERGGSSRDGM